MLGAGDPRQKERACCDRERRRVRKTLLSASRGLLCWRCGDVKHLSYTSIAGHCQNTSRCVFETPRLVFWCTILEIVRTVFAPPWRGEEALRENRAASPQDLTISNFSLAANSFYLFSFARMAASILSRTLDDVVGGLTVVGFGVGVGVGVGLT